MGCCCEDYAGGTPTPPASGGGAGAAFADAFGFTQPSYLGDVSTANNQQAAIYRPASDVVVAAAWLYSKSYEGGDPSIYWGVYDDPANGGALLGSQWSVGTPVTTGWQRIPVVGSPVSLIKGRDYWLFARSPFHDLGQKYNVGDRCRNTAFGSLNESPIVFGASQVRAILVCLEFELP